MINKGKYFDKKSIVQFLKFGLVGVSNTMVSYVLYAASLLILQEIGVDIGTKYLWANGIAFVISVVWSYYWNNRFVFVGRKNNHWLKVLGKTYIAYSFTGLFLSGILLSVWIQVFRISEYLAPIINLVFTVPINFIINKFWAFKSE